jgi:ATP/maltotriose-dependent transcriptional regulator MalT
MTTRTVSRYLRAQLKKELHRKRERDHVASARWNIRNGHYEHAVRDLIWAYQQQTAADTWESVIAAAKDAEDGE